MPYGRCIVTGGYSGGAFGVKDAAWGIANVEGDGVKNEGFTRLVARLIFPLLDSRVSRGGIKQDEAGKVGVGWTVGITDGLVLDSLEVTGTVAATRGGCPEIAAFDVFPMFRAFWKNKIISMS